MPSFAQISLRTERLLLRPLRESDAPALLTVFSDARVTRYLARGAWDTIEQAHELIAKDEQAMTAGTYLRLGLERVVDNNLLGECSLFNLVERSRRAEVGYALGHAAWGSGFMNEALIALLEFGFGALTLNRVEADIDPRNAASARSLARLGFTREGHLRERWIVNGEVSDSSLYGLLAREWHARYSGK